MTSRAKLTVFSALATALAALCLTPLLVTRGWITHAFLVIAVLAAAGAGLRRTPLPRLLVPLLQLVVLAALLLVGFAGSTALWGGVLPGPDSVEAVGRTFADGFQDIQEYAIPAPPTDGLRLILVTSIGLIALVVDAVAVTYRRAALAGLPLLALYSVGTGLAGGGSGWVWFGLAAAGYLVLLFADGQDRVSRWGRVFRGTSRGTESTGTVSQSGRQVGVLALALALVVPVLLPQLDGGLISRHSGTGSGSGGSGTGGGTSSLSPLVSLASQVTRPSDTELLTYTIDPKLAPGTYLRTGSLDEFNGTEWRLSGPSSAQFTDNIVFGAPDGLTDPTGPRRFTSEFTIGDRLDNSWLPMPYPAERASVAGNWKVDGLTGTVMPDRGQSLRKLRYKVTSLDLKPTPAQLRDARAVDTRIGGRYLGLPANLPQIVREKALEVTRGSASDYDKALALQNWFTGSEFSYSTTAETGSGSKAIERFLLERSGFCVHFASTMAAMARTLNIPSRVAVGFTPGQAKGAGQYAVSGQQYHAWPELYFEGYGWLRFEPTPSRGGLPEYARPAVAPTTAPTQQPSAQPSAASAAPQPSTSSSCDANLRRLGECGDDRRSSGVQDAERSWLFSWQALAVLAAVLVVAALLLTPMLWRLRRRRRRLGPGGRRRPGGEGPVRLTDEQVLAAWAELIDTAWDLGIPPDDAHTPRATARRIAETAELDLPAAEAAGRVALATERVLYARSAEVTAPLAADVRTTRDGLRAGASRGERARAVLLPASSAQLWWRVSDAVLAVRLAVGTGLSRLAEPVRRAGRRLRRRGD